jgi:hypothetical protein
MSYMECFYVAAVTSAFISSAVCVLVIAALHDRRR